MDEAVPESKTSMIAEKNITQIIALPRSRTAWLSVALTTANCFGFHDASHPPGVTAETYLARLNSRSEQHVVDCSSGLLIRPDLIDAVSGPIIVIERDFDSAKDSLADHINDYGKVENLWPAIEASFHLCTARFNSRIELRVGFNELSDEDVIEEIFDIAAPGQFDSQRIEMLQKLNIQEVKKKWAL